MDEQEVRKIIREELAFFLKNEKFVFSRPIQVIDGRNIQFGVTTGSDLGNTFHLTQNKMGFYGADAVVQQSHIANPSGGLTADGEARTAINSILSTLETYGLLKTS